MRENRILKYCRLLCTLLIVLVALPAPLRQAEGGGWQIHGSDPVVRLHVRASGDSPAEQSFKMAVASRVQQLLWEKRPPEENGYRAYLEFLQDYLPELESSLREFAASAAEEAQIELLLAEETFPLRTYGRRIYPAGKYTALTVTIGDGTGENWWCLLFPSLCLPPVSFDHRSVEEEQNLNDEKEKNLLATGVEKAPDFDTRPRAAGRKLWQFKLWEFIKRPGQHLFEKAAEIFYN